MSDPDANIWLHDSAAATGAAPPSDSRLRVFVIGETPARTEQSGAAWIGEAVDLSSSRVRSRTDFSRGLPDCDGRPGRVFPRNGVGWTTLATGLEDSVSRAGPACRR